MSADGRGLTQSFYIGKMYFWTQQDLASHLLYFSHVAPGHVQLQFGRSGGELPPGMFHATQELLAARVNATMTSKGAECGIITTSAVVAPTANLLAARLAVSKPCTLNVTLRTPNMYGLPIEAKVSPSALMLNRHNTEQVDKQ